MATFDYVIVTAIAVPLTAALTYLLLIGLTSIYQFASATVGWPFP